MSEDFCENPQPCRVTNCENPFAMVQVSYLVRGGTTVTWKVGEEVTDPGPYTFQLQYSPADIGAENCSWENVGDPVVDAFFASDPFQRVFDSGNRGFYRVVLTTGGGETYASEPAAAPTNIPPREWRYAQEILRKERLSMNLGDAVNGILLKLRKFGQPCPRCVDLTLGSSIDSHCLNCYGTTRECGYHLPVGCIPAELGLRSARRELSGASGPQMTTEVVVIKARMLMFPRIERYDVWINPLTDERYFVGAISHEMEVKSIPLVASVELRLAPASPVIYDFDITSLLP